MTVKEIIQTYDRKIQDSATNAGNISWDAWKAATSDDASNQLRRVTPEHQAAVAEAIQAAGAAALELYKLKIGEDADPVTVQMHLAAEGFYDADTAKRVLEAQNGDMNPVSQSIIQRHQQTRADAYRRDQGTYFQDPDHQDEARAEIKATLEGAGIAPKQGTLDEFLQRATPDRLEGLAQDALSVNFDPKSFANRYRTVFDYTAPNGNGGSA